ncbi:MAG: tripartite tricarboxylate transporter substrate-binding protein [Tropicimonas sp.]|uniref:tripartite tricarboxylate transporter substrate-binding protein n=1 Tax=Tropicimonas sp. TaxID=2067044 RepID=UPI003A8A2AD6
MRYRDLVKSVASVMAAALLATPAAAEFPDRTIEVIFPWGPNPAYSVSQIIAKAMGEELGQTITVVSTPGAAGMKAFITAMERNPDGYSIIDGYVAPLVLQPILGAADWTYKDFKPLHAGVSNAFSIGGRPNDKRWSDFEGMMDWGRQNPGKLRYSSGSRNNLPHMVIAKVLQSYGVVAQNIPYSQDGDAIKDLKSGVLDFSFVNVSDFLADKEKLDILLVMSELPGAKAAYDGAPDITELGVDLGLSGLAPRGWDWWLVHPDTPDDVTGILRAAMARAMNRPDVIEAIERVNHVPLEWDYDQYEEVIAPVIGQLESMGNALTWEEEELKKLK